MSDAVTRKRQMPSDAGAEEQDGPQSGFQRPEASILPAEALVPGANLISPAPNQFTHELTRAQPFYYAGAREEASPDGELPAATPVTLLVYDGGDYCRVVDGQGLYVEIAYDSLRTLSHHSATHAGA